MSDGIETIRTADVGAVAVRKTIETGDDDTATVTLEVTADGEDPIAVRLVEPGLAAVPTDDVDLQEDRGAGHWRLDDAVLERGFEGGESSIAVYRVRGVDEERFRRLDVDPAIEIDTGASAALGDVVDRAGADAVRRVLEGRADSLTVDEIGGEREAGGADGREIAGSDSPGGSGAPDAREATGTADDRGAAPSTTASSDGDVTEGPAGIGGSAGHSGTTEIGGSAEAGGSADPDGVAQALLAELRAEDDDDVAGALREELRAGGSQDVRIAHLQRRVADLAAYADLLETVIDEYGPLDEVVDELHADLDCLDGEVETVDERLDDLESFADRLSDVFRSVDANGER